MLQKWITSKNDTLDFRPNTQFSYVTLVKTQFPWWKRFFLRKKHKGYIDIKLVQVKPEHRSQGVFQQWYFDHLAPLAFAYGYKIRVSFVLTERFCQFWRRQPGFKEIPCKHGSSPSFEEQ